MKLPEMSVIDTHLPSNHKTRAYTAEQMLEWGKATAAAEREECAKLCLETEPFYGVMFYNAIRARGNT